MKIALRGESQHFLARCHKLRLITAHHRQKSFFQSARKIKSARVFEWAKINRCKRPKFSQYSSFFFLISYAGENVECG